MLRSSESARVFGIDFKSVRERGSQFKVEAVMFRIAKPESFLLLSPTRQEVCLSPNYMCALSHSSLHRSDGKMPPSASLSSWSPSPPSTSPQWLSSTFSHSTRQ